MVDGYWVGIRGVGWYWKQFFRFWLMAGFTAQGVPKFECV
jgi:hypothetical protein